MLLPQLVARGDLELAWQAADALGYLGAAHGEVLVGAGAVEELTYLLQVGGWVAGW